MNERTCNGCSMCCYLPQIESLDKPWNKWCVHCTTVSCSIYERRPKQCADYLCGWLRLSAVPDYWFPAKSRMVITSTEDSDGPIIAILVDPEHPQNWRRFPYYRDLKRWSFVATNLNPRGYVHVFCGEKHWLVLPDRNILDPQPGVVIPRADGSLDYLPIGSKKLADNAANFLNSNGRRI